MPDCERRRYRKPVKWLLGRDLLSTFRTTVLSAALSKQFDVRDWMRGDTFDLSAAAGDGEAFWFDYLSDTGDGQRATYSVAYLCMTDLWLGANGKTIATSPGEGTHLPRGSFAFVGGDTAYHVADYDTLAVRVRRPFNWAATDLAQAGRPPERRPLFGIPGNHDYYDFLDGFGRQFRAPVLVGNDWPVSRRKPYPELDLTGFRREQHGTYMELKLPFGWSLFGIDQQPGRIDVRQLHFFRGILANRASSKLILALPQPLVACGAVDQKVAQAIRDLGLPIPFDGEELAPGSCRLDLAGDVHHYARHQPPSAPAGPDRATSYASVVSGSGGAFMHPTHTVRGTVAPDAIYPCASISRWEVVRRLLDPLRVARSGLVTLFAGLLAVMLYAGSTIPQSSRDVLESHLRLPTASDADLNQIPMSLRVEPWAARPQPGTASPGKEALAVVFYACLVGFVGVCGHGYRTSLRGRVKSPRGSGATVSRLERLLQGLSAAPPLLFVAFVAGFTMRYATDSARGSFGSLPETGLMLLFLAASVLCFWLSSVFTESVRLLTRLGRTASGAWDDAFWVFLVLAALCNAALGLWRYGSYPAAIVITDVMYLSVLFVLAVTVFAPVAGGAGWRTRDDAGLWACGVWHTVLQVAIPFGLVTRQHWFRVAAVTAAVVTGTYLAQLAFAYAARSRAGWTGDRRYAAGLLATWLVIGGAALVGAWMGPPDALPPVTWGRIVAAGMLGATCGCVWLGWYLCVASMFNGHNNEAGGASLIEGYKQFIRFRLTPEELTGFVIGIEEPAACGWDLRPHLVDVFTIRPS